MLSGAASARFAAALTTDPSAATSCGSRASSSTAGAQRKRLGHRSLKTARQFTPGGGRGGQYTRASSATTQTRREN